MLFLPKREALGAPDQFHRTGPWIGRVPTVLIPPSRQNNPSRRHYCATAAVELIPEAALRLELDLNEVDLDEGIKIALTALHAERLALLCGAGLSMARPSKVPSAAQLAAAAKSQYEATYGAGQPSLPTALGDQAEYFFRRGELETVFLRTLIDPHTFAGPPNAGHNAVADLLLVRGIQAAVSTNVDTLIETAGLMLFGQVGVGIDRDTLAKLLPETCPLLKLHGCWASDPDHTVWARGQLEEGPVASRIAGNAEWLSVHLLDRDLIIVGYFTDWDYLNEVLERSLGQVRPARVVVVDPSDGADLLVKAPVLYELGQRATSTFVHVRVSGDAFLEHLRIEFSQSFVRRILHWGKDAYEQHKGTAVDTAWLESPLTDADVLWRVRRDLEGCLPNHPALERVPPEEPLLGLTLLQLRSRGAVAEGPYWLLDGRRIRVVRSANKLLHAVQAAFERETPPVVAPDIVIAVGAEELALPANIVRTGTSPTIARGTVGRWVTYSDAASELGL